MKNLIIKNIYPIVKNPTPSLFTNESNNQYEYARYKPEIKELIIKYLKGSHKFLIYYNQEIQICDEILSRDADVLGISQIIDGNKYIYLYDFVYHRSSEKILNYSMMDYLSDFELIEVDGSSDIASQILSRTSLIPNMINIVTPGSKIKLTGINPDYSFTEVFVTESGDKLNEYVVKPGLQMLYQFSPELAKFKFRGFKNEFSSYYNDVNISTVKYLILGDNENSK